MQRDDDCLKFSTRTTLGTPYELSLAYISLLMSFPDFGMLFCIEPGITTRAADGSIKFAPDLLRNPPSGTLCRGPFDQFDIGRLMVGIGCISVDKQVRNDVT